MKMPWFLMTSTSGAPSGTSRSTPFRVIFATLPDPVPFCGLAEVQRDLVAGRGFLAVGVCVFVALQVLLRHGRQRVLVPVERVEIVCRVVQRPAGLDRLVGAGLDAEATVHAEAEVDLVAVDVEGAVLAGRRLDEDTAVGAGLGAGGAAGAARST